MNLKTIILISAIILIGGAILYLETTKTKQRPSEKSNNIPIQTLSMNKEAKAKIYEPAKEIEKPAGFINTDKIKIADLIGKKVILVDFWTYSCINCQRTTPYLNAWYEKYKDKGLEVIGIHTPEFEFEKDYNNVATAVKKFGIKYPVVLDNDYGTWFAYNNRYWPRKYLIDIDGYIVYDHIGEGDYEKTEKKIQEALQEKMVLLKEKGNLATEPIKVAGVPEIDLSQARSPEIYFGADRNNYLGNGKSGKYGEQTLTEPTGIKTNILYLVGGWDFDSQYVENKTAGAKIIFRYQGKNVYFVAGSDNGVSVKILRDGQPVKKVLIKDSRLYKLIEDSDYGEHTLEIIIDQPGLNAFTFTFG